jgi:hypothetical protein
MTWWHGAQIKQRGAKTRKWYIGHDMIYGILDMVYDIWDMVATSEVTDGLGNKEPSPTTSKYYLLFAKLSQTMITDHGYSTGLTADSTLGMPWNPKSQTWSGRYVCGLGHCVLLSHSRDVISRGSAKNSDTDCRRSASMWSSETYCECLT